MLIQQSLWFMKVSLQNGIVNQVHTRVAAKVDTVAISNGYLARPSEAAYECNMIRQPNDTRVPAQIDGNTERNPSRDNILNIGTD